MFLTQGDLTYNGTFSSGLFNGTGEWFSENGHQYKVARAPRPRVSE